MRVLLTVLFLSIFTVACVPATTVMSPSGSYAGTADNPDADGPPPTFAQFTDIPIPDKAVMDLERTLLLGSENSWIGRLVFAAPYNASGMFDFYMAEMPKFGWNEITVVRSETSVLTFRLNSRIATIQLQNGGMNGTEVAFTVSPEGNRTAK